MVGIVCDLDVEMDHRSVLGPVSEDLTVRQYESTYRSHMSTVIQEGSVV